jgi:hypothetical protein
MGCLVDTFIICMKKEWNECGFEKKDKFAAAVPEEYQPMFRGLLETYQLGEIIDTQNYEKSKKVYEIAYEYESDEVTFSSRYRGECLQQILRRVFFDTIMIIQNDFDWDKNNQFFVVNSKEVITEDQWKTETPGDQAFCHQVAKTLVEEKDFESLKTIDGVTYIKGEDKDRN